MHSQSSSRAAFVEESVQQCIDYLQRDRVPPSRGGQKDYAPDGSWLEGKKLESFHKERFEVLSEQRVRVKNVLSTAQWDEEKGKARITQRTGKWWHTLGHNENGAEWLLPEEALYLMDEGQLQMFSDGLPLSLEEGYSIVLSRHVPVQQYIVYGHLMRYGYILHRFTKPTNVTDYERKIGINKVSQVKKRKHSIKDEEPSVPQKKCNNQTNDVTSCDNGNNGHDNIKSMDTEHQGSGDNSNLTKASKQDICNNTTDLEQDDNSETLNKGIGNKTTNSLEQHKNEPVHKNNVEKKTDCEDNVHENEQLENKLVHKNNIEDKTNFESKACDNEQTSGPKKTCSLPYSNWNWDDYNFPSAQLSGSEKPKPDLEFSLGSGIKKDVGSRNWGEYKAKGRTVESPVDHLWSGDVTPLVRPSHATTTANILERLRIIPTLSAEDNKKRRPSDEADECYKISYDMFKPDKKFTKTSQQVPIARLCIVRDSSAVPDLSVITRLHHLCPDGVPLKFAIVESGAVSFFSFDLVNIPIQLSPLEKYH